MKVSPININHVQNSYNAVTKKGITNPLKTVAPFFISSSAAAGVTALAMANNKQIDDNNSLFQRMLNHKVDDKNVFDKNGFQAVKYAKTLVPTVYQYIMKNPENISLCSYTPETKMDFANLKIDTVNKAFNLNVDFTKTPLGPVIRNLEQNFTQKDGSSVQIKLNLINGSDRYKQKTTTVKKDGERIAETDMPIIKDILGNLHKTKVIAKTSKDGLHKEMTTIQLDGTKEITKIELKEIGGQKRVVGSVCHQYSGDVLDSKTIYKTSYEEVTNPETNQKTYLPTVNIVCHDYKHNTKVTVEKHGLQKILTKQIKEITNSKTGKVTTEILEKSDVEGVYNSKIIDENGVEHIESLGTKNPDGSVFVKKHLVSLDGTVTDYVYKSSEKGDDIEMDYKVTSSDGKLLSNVNRKRKEVGEDKIYSTINGHVFEITRKDDGLDIKDMVSGKVDEMKYADYLADCDDEVKAMDFFDSLPADALLNLKERKYKVFVNDNAESSKFIVSNQMIQTSDNMYIYSHEAGHSIDCKKNDKDIYVYSTALNNDFRQAYEDEKLNFIKAFPDVERDYINYFINGAMSYDGLNGAPDEAVAESNTMTCLGLPAQKYAIRNHYLQKHFPKTIAMASMILNPKNTILLG